MDFQREAKQSSAIRKYPYALSQRGREHEPAIHIKLAQ